MLPTPQHTGAPSFPQCLWKRIIAFPPFSPAAHQNQLISLKENCKRIHLRCLLKNRPDAILKAAEFPLRPTAISQVPHWKCNNKVMSSYHKSNRLSSIYMEDAHQSASRPSSYDTRHVYNLCQSQQMPPCCVSAFFAFFPPHRGIFSLSFFKKVYRYLLRKIQGSLVLQEAGIERGERTGFFGALPIVADLFVCYFQWLFLLSESFVPSSRPVDISLLVIHGWPFIGGLLSVRSTTEVIEAKGRMPIKGKAYVCRPIGKSHTDLEGRQARRKSQHL